MGLPFAQNMHGGPDFRHILRKFTGLKEGVGENIPNTGRVIVHCRETNSVYAIITTPLLMTSSVSSAIRKGHHSGIKINRFYLFLSDFVDK